MRIRYLYYRIRQMVMSFVMVVINPRDSKLLVGPNSIYKLPELLKANGNDRVEIITTNGFVRRGTLAKLIKDMEDANIKVIVYGAVPPDPMISCCDEAARLYRENRCNAIIAIGGGSVIDCAKMVSIRIVKPGRPLKKMSGILKIRRRLPPIYAVPATAGTGSKASATAVITDDQTHYKYTINDLCLIPGYAILDPVLTISLALEQTYLTGIDALCHSVEAYTNRFVSPKAKRNDTKAIKIIYDNLELAAQDGNNLQVRQNMLLVAYYAGVAFRNAYVGYVHAIAPRIGDLDHNAVRPGALWKKFGEKTGGIG